MSTGERKSVIEVIKKDEKVDFSSGVVTFSTGLTDVLEPGEIGILVSEENNTDKVILNPLYMGGELVVKMKIISTPARKYKDGEKIANLLIVR